MNQLPILVSATLIAGASLPLAVFDFRYHRLPNPFTYSMIAISFLGAAFAAGLSNDWPGFVLALGLNAGLTLLGFLLFWFGGLGLGDVKYLVATNQVLGFLAPELVLIALIVAVCSAAIVGVALLAIKRLGIKDRIAFGPFLVLGYFVSLVPSLGIA
jgi:leader peptidase (prepilin peptidase)/N-methyltransferase